MSTKIISIGIVSYSGCMQSAVQGLKEMFTLANDIAKQNNEENHFSVTLYNVDTLAQNTPEHSAQIETPQLQVLIIPPSIVGDYYLNPDQTLVHWIKKQHQLGAIACSICTGTFILAATGLLQQRKATTHWDLTTQFINTFPQVDLDTNQILINDGDIVTAGGLMSWMDLGLEIVAQFSTNNIMRRLGKIMVIDTGQREQRYYQSFSAKLDHGDKEILVSQHYMQKNYSKPINITLLSETCLLSERTFLRRFVKATGYKPIQYLQRVRVQKACDLIETSNNTIDTISSMVGYEDSSSFRKIFVKVIGLTPKEFKNRFVNY